MTLLNPLIVEALDTIKAIDTQTLDVRTLTDITDTLIITTGNSSRHVKAIAEKVMQAAREQAYKPLGIEGEKEAEWILVDLGETIVHVMLESSRLFYQLEKLWSVEPSPRESRHSRS